MGRRSPESALEYAQIIAVRCGAGLALVRVVHASLPVADSALQKAEASVARLADDLTHMGMKVKTALITMGLQRIGLSRKSTLARLIWW